MERIRWSFVRRALWLFLVLAAAPARAGGFEIPDLGVKKTAMGAVIRRPDHASALYHDPAGLLLSDRRRLYISAGLALLHTGLHLSRWDHSPPLVPPTG